MRSFFLVLLAVTVASAAPKTLPTSWQKCKRTDPKLEECLRDAVHVAVRELSENGAKEFGVFPIDPLFMSKVDIEQGKGPVSIDLHFTDLNIHGLKDLIVMGPVKAQVDQVHFEAQISVPKGITLRGLYKVNGKVLLLPIQGNGECELNLENANATVKIDGTLIKKDDIEYGNIKTLKFELDTTRLKIRLENLFNGRKDLSDNMNAFLNENWREILQELKPSIQDAFGAAFAEIINRIFSKVPFNNLFL